MTNRIYIHVGYPKAASTTLQKHLFNNHPQVNNLGLYPTTNWGKETEEVKAEGNKCFFLENEHLRKFYQDLIRLGTVEYENSNNEQVFREHIKPLLRDDKINLFSHEGLVDTFSADRGVKAKRLKRLFPHAKIIFIIRRQPDIITSQYRDCPFDPNCWTSGMPVSFNRWLEQSFAPKNIQTGYLISLRYYEMAQFYAGLFGKENIGIFLLEELAYSPALFAEKLSGFMEINKEKTKQLLSQKHENKEVSAWLNRFRNLRRRLCHLGVPVSKDILPFKVRKLFLNLLKRGRSKPVEMSSYWQKKISDFYKDSNKKLQKEFNLNLREYQYPL